LWPVLKSLPEQNHPDLLVGFNQADDSGVVRLSEDTALIFTVDFFPAIVDDPFVFGQVAAANALSDIYAMGGEPLCALNIVCFPTRDLPMDMLSDVLRGGAEKVNEAGAVIVGGHSIKDNELKYGLAVTGKVHPDKIIEIGGAKPGDKLILTKALGTGIYSTALKNGALDRDREKILYEAMVTLNSAASSGMVDAGADACTDVTGFGLLGHALEMAQSSDVTLRIEIGELPVLPGALDYARDGYLTGGGMTNRQFALEELRVEGGLSNEMEMLLYDPQTSGGLLISVPASSAQSYVEMLRSRGIESASVIGEVLEAGEKRLFIAAD
jgi:selenide,water dikinase